MDKENEEIFVENLSVTYDEKQALWDVHFSVPKGSLVGIVGPNGAGKSSLIKAMIGLLKPVSGVVRYCGKPLADMKGKIAYVSQRQQIDWNFPITVFEVVLMGIYGKLGIFRRPSKEDKKRATEILKLIGMENLADRQISDLSGGQQQRLFVARALLQDADIFFLDEPFCGIDMATEMLLVDLFRDLVSKGKTIFVVHHDLKSVESYFSHLILLNLRVIGSGETKEVFTEEALNKLFDGGSDFLKEAIRLTKAKQEGLK